MVKWYHKSLPSLRCGFDSRYPLQFHGIVSEIWVLASGVIAHIAQSVEHFLGKEEVIGSNPIVSTICCAEGHGVETHE